MAQLKHILVDVLGMNASEKEHVVSELVDVVKIFSKDSRIAIELLESSSKDSVIEKYLNNKGAGIHHIALTVDSINNTIAYLKYKDVALVYEEPQIGAGNKLITFIHPKSTPGLLIELCQRT